MSIIPGKCQIVDGPAPAGTQALQLMHILQDDVDEARVHNMT